MNIWSIIVLLGLMVIVYYCIVSNKKHWQQINFQASLLMQASEKKANGDDERWIPYSKMTEDIEGEEIGAENEEEETEMLSW